MLVPFVGVFIYFAVWGTFYPIPGLSEPHDTFVKRISGAMGATTATKGVYELTRAITSSYGKNQTHTFEEPMAVLVTDSKALMAIDVIDTTGVVETVTIPNSTQWMTVTEMAISHNIPLLEEKPIENSVYAREIPHTAYNPFVMPSINATAFAIMCLIASLTLVQKKATASPTASEERAHIRPVLLKRLRKISMATQQNEPYQRFGSTDAEKHYFVPLLASFSVYETMDALVKPNIAPVVSNGTSFPEQSLIQSTTAEIPAPLWPQPLVVHEKVAQAISRLEYQRVAASLSSLPHWDRLPIQELNERPKDLAAKHKSLNTLNNKPSTPALSAVHAPPRQWALVVRRPECVWSFLYVQMAWALVTNLNASKHKASESEICAEDPRLSGNRKRKRPSQLKRRRYAKRLREQAEQSTSSSPSSANPQQAMPSETISTSDDD